MTPHYTRRDIQAYGRMINKFVCHANVTTSL